MKSKSVRAAGIVLAVILGVAALLYLGGLISQLTIGYQKWLADGGMTRKAKALLIGTVTAIMLPGFILMDKVPVGRAIMAIVWVGHIVYFGFKVQTITQQEADDAMAQALEE